MKIPRFQVIFMLNEASILETWKFKFDTSRKYISYKMRFLCHSFFFFFLQTKINTISLKLEGNCSIKIKLIVFLPLIFALASSLLHKLLKCIWSVFHFLNIYKRLRKSTQYTQLNWVFVNKISKYKGGGFYLFIYLIYTLLCIFVDTSFFLSIFEVYLITKNH